jgi:predicted nucleic acid-binding protein
MDRRSCPDFDSERFFVRLQELPIRMEHHLDLELATQLARKYRLSVYDASYLALAMKENLPLATLDGDIIQAAPLCGVSLFA